MIRICTQAITYRGIIVGGYVVERSAANVLYIWRTDLNGNKIRNVSSTFNEREACHQARIYARMASM